jgi:hypothetical protein
MCSSIHSVKLIALVSRQGEEKGSMGTNVFDDKVRFACQDFHFEEPKLGVDAVEFVDDCADALVLLLADRVRPGQNWDRE